MVYDYNDIKEIVSLETDLDGGLEISYYNFKGEYFSHYLITDEVLLEYIKNLQNLLTKN